MSSFVHLHVHTEFSIEDSIVRIAPLMAQVAKYKQPAIAITDMQNLFGSIKFYRAAIAAGVKPIIGAEVKVIHPQGAVSRWLLLCQNQTGYHNLCQLLTRCHLKPADKTAVMTDQATLEAHHEGLIAIHCFNQGLLQQALLKQDQTTALSFLKNWQKLFGDRLYLEIQHLGKTGEPEHLAALLPCATQTEIPLVATNDVRFLASEDFEAHDVKVCIQNSDVLDDPQRPRRYNESQYLKSSKAMQTLFARMPGAIENTLEIAKRCNFQFELSQHYLPNYKTPDGSDVNRYCQILVKQRLTEYLDNKALPAEQCEVYNARLDFEMAIITKMRFVGYFLIVADFIAWAKSHGIPVGPGRGSGAGSLVAFMLRITGLDPIEHGLLFERFLNPERVSMPDFDIDFCMEGRDRVIDYVADKYGQDCVSQIITYGTMAAKAVVRDVGRVMGHPYGFVDKLAKLIPFELGITLQKALDDEDQLRERYEKEEPVKTLIDMGIKLEGIVRNAGKHAGGVIIAPKPLTAFTALYCEQEEQNPVTQLDKDDVERIGLIKFDFLGLRTLTTIHWAIQTIRRLQPNQPIDIDHIPLDDAQTFSLLKSCHTTTVFQLESRGMRDLIKRLQPDSFEEIVALVALFRPGPLQSGMVDEYIDRKHGRSRIDCFHDMIKPILEPTYGVILYQEQVMQIAQVLSRYSLGKADLLRRAMGKKKPEEMAKQRQGFVEGAVSNQVPEQKAAYIFDIIEKFAGYGFNKSHSAAYALIAYQTAYLKAHHPHAYLAAVLSSDMDHSDKVAVNIAECKRMKLTLLPPDINTSDYPFTVTDQAIRYGLGAIKGVGQSAIEHITDERDKNGPYTSLFNLCKRCNKQALNRRALEALIKSGACDTFNVDRSMLFTNIDLAMQYAAQRQHNHAAGQHDLFASDATTDHDQEPKPLDAVKWSPLSTLQNEKDVLGLYLSGHPMTFYEQELAAIGIQPIHALSPNSKQATIAGIVKGARSMLTRRGDRMMVLGLENQNTEIDVTVFSDVLEQKRTLIQNDALLVIKGDVGIDTLTGRSKISAKNISTLEHLRAKRVKRLHIHLNSQTPELIEQLKATLHGRNSATCPVHLTLDAHGAQVSFACDDLWRVEPTDALLAQIQLIEAVQAARYEYS